MAEQPPTTTRRSQAMERAVQNLRGFITSSETHPTKNPLVLAAENYFERTVDQILHLLQDIVQLKVAEKVQLNEVCSLQDQAALRMGLELVVSWGLAPYWLPGVGIPVYKRSKLPRQLLIAPPRVDPLLNFRRLFETTRRLLALLEDVDFSSLIVSHYLVDVCASLLQLSFAPVEENAAVLTNAERQQSEQSLDRLLTTVHPAYVSEALTLLLSPLTEGAPAWLRAKCGLLLSRNLLRPGGVRIMLEQVFSGASARDDPLVVAKAVKILCTPPRQMKKTEYYTALAPQLLQLLRLSAADSEHLYRTAATCIAQLLAVEPALTRESVVQPLLSPLLMYADAEELLTLHTESNPHIRDDEDENSISREIVVDEQRLAECLEDIKRLMLAAHGDTKQTLLAEVARVVSPLFRLYCFASRSKSGMKRTAEELLVLFFRTSEGASASLKDLVLPKAFTSLAPDLVFAPGPSGGVTIRRAQPGMARDTAWEAECLVALLQALGKDEVVGNLFVDLLHELEQRHGLSAQAEEEAPPPERSMLLLQLLALMTESLGPAVLKNLVQIVTFARVLLDTGDDEVISLALSILASLFGGAVKLQKEEEILLFDLVPTLDRLSIHPDAAIREIAAQLKVKVLSRDKAWAAGTAGSRSSDSGAAPDVAIQEVLRDLADPLVPVRAHGLVALRRLVLQRDAVTLRNLDKIAQIFQAQLHDSDSYIFLSAINGLSALGDIQPETFIPLLGRAFEDASASLEVRLKVAEALMLVALRCGETLPRWAKLFMAPFLRGLRDPTPEIRASALSNIATLCEGLRFSLQPYLRELLDALTHILSIEKEAEVRRGGVFVFTLLFKGLGADVFSLLPQEMQRIYQLLATTRDLDSDEVVRFQAKMAIDTLEAAIQSAIKQHRKVQP